MAKQTKKDFSSISTPSLTGKNESKDLREKVYSMPQTTVKNKGGRPQVKKGGKRSNFLFSQHTIKLLNKGWHFEEFASQTAFLEHIIHQYCKDKPYYTPDEDKDE